jgi:hypothetical protein
MTEYDDELMKLAQTISRWVRCLLIDCARCELRVLRIEREHRDRGEAGLSTGALLAYGALLRVQADGARDFKKYRPPGLTHARTYTWRCAHGHADSRKLERFLRAWPQDDPTVKPQRVLRLKLGVDV